MGVTERGEVLISRSLRAECDCLDNEAQARALKWAPKHITNWEEAQCEDALLAACHKWLSKKRSVIPQKRDALLKECMKEHSTSEEGKALYHVRNNLTLRKWLMYVNITPRGETEGLLALVVPTAHRGTALNGVHQDAGHQGQQRTLALAEECFWWPKMVEDCRALVKGCQRCQIFEGAVVRAPLPYKSIHATRVGSSGFHEHRNNNGAEPAAKHKECAGHHRPFHEILYGIYYQGPESQNCHANTVRMVHCSIWCTCQVT